MSTRRTLAALLSLVIILVFPAPARSADPPALSGAPTALRLVAEPAAVPAGQPVRVSAVLTTLDGRQHVVDPALIELRMTGGIIRSDGTLHAEAPGRYRVHARLKGGGPVIAPVDVAFWGRPERLALLGPSELVAGGPTPFLLAAVDAHGTPVRDVQGTAWLVAGDQEVMVQLTDGLGRAEVTATEPGQPMLLLAEAGELRGQREVAVVAPVAQAPHFPQAEGFLPAVPGGSAWLPLVVLDQAGRPLRDGGQHRLELSVEGPAELASETVHYEAVPDGNGQAEVLLWALPGQTGRVVVTATLPGAGQATTELRAVHVLPPSSLTLQANSAELTVTTVDDQGVPLSAAAPVELLLSGTVEAVKSPDAEVELLDGGRRLLAWPTGGRPALRLRLQGSGLVEVTPAGPWRGAPTWLRLSDDGGALRPQPVTAERLAGALALYRQTRPQPTWAPTAAAADREALSYDLWQASLAQEHMKEIYGYPEAGELPDLDELLGKAKLDGWEKKWSLDGFILYGTKEAPPPEPDPTWSRTAEEILDGLVEQFYLELEQLLGLAEGGDCAELRAIRQTLIDRHQPLAEELKKALVREASDRHEFETARAEADRATTKLAEAEAQRNQAQADLDQAASDLQDFLSTNIAANGVSFTGPIGEGMYVKGHVMGATTSSVWFADAAGVQNYLDALEKLKQDPRYREIWDRIHDAAARLRAARERIPGLQQEVDAAQVALVAAQNLYDLSARERALWQTATEHVLAQIRQLEAAYPDCFPDPYLTPGVSEPPVLAPVPPPVAADPGQDPRDTGPPLPTSTPETAWSPCPVLAWGEFQPSQGVWQDDEHFADRPDKQLSRPSEEHLEAELRMIQNRSTLLFGVRGNRWQIPVEGVAWGTVPVPVSVRFKLEDASGERILHEQPLGTINLDGPCGEMTAFDFRLDASQGLLPTPFTFPKAGEYQIRMQVVRETGAVVDEVLLSGWVRATDAPDLLFTTAALSPFSLEPTAADSLIPVMRDATRLAGDSARFLPDYLPVAPNSILAVPRRSLHDLRSVVATLPPGAFSFEKEAAAVANLVQYYVGSAWLTGFDRVMVLMRDSDFDLIGRSGAQAFAPNQKVLFVRAGSSHFTVAHELVHTLPYLWTDSDMVSQCGKDYHNTGNLGNGFRITLGGAENRAPRTTLAGVMGPAPLSDEVWIEQCTYWQLTNALTSLPDPELLGVRGWISRHGSAGFQSGFTLLGEPDLQPGSSGEYALVLKDKAGAELGRFGFTPRFAYDHGDEVSHVAFAYRIPKLAGAAVLELHGPKGLLSSRAISQGAPTVNLSATATAQGARITWTAADPDGDPLTYSLLYSPDGGSTWTPLAMDLPDTGLDVSRAALVPGGRHLFRVVASDGINSTEATLASPIRLPGEGGRTVELAIDSTAAWVDGSPVSLEVPARISASRTLVPLRFVAESLGADVAYDDATRQITIQLDGTTVELWLDQTRARVSGRESQLDVAPLVVQGRSLVPIRFVAEALGAKVEWDGDLWRVLITR